MDGSILDGGSPSSGSDGCLRWGPMLMWVGRCQASHPSCMYSIGPSWGSCLPEGRRGEQLATKEVRWCCPIILCSVAEPPGSTALPLLPSLTGHSIGASIYAFMSLSCLVINRLIWEGCMVCNLNRLTGYERPGEWPHMALAIVTCTPCSP